MKTMKTTKATLALLVLVSLILGTGWVHARYSIENVEFVHDGLHYTFSQWRADPIWLSLTPNSAYSSLKTLEFPEEYIIDDNLVYNTEWTFRYELEGRKAVLESIEDRAFSQSFPFLEVTFPSSLKRIGKEAFAYTSLEKINFSSGLIYLGERAFAGCDALNEIAIPESVQYIGPAAFAYCSYLEKVDLPATLRSLSGYTFYCSTLIKDIYCRAAVPPTVSDHDFGYLKTDYPPHYEAYPAVDTYNCVIHVPAESIDLYRNATGWKLFRNIVPLTEQEVGVDNPVDNTESISYQVEKDTLIIKCKKGDSITICDTSGIVLQHDECEQDCDIIHRGNGIRILNVNGHSVKVLI